MQSVMLLLVMLALVLMVLAVVRAVAWLRERDPTSRHDKRAEALRWCGASVGVYALAFVVAVVGRSLL